MPATLTLLNRTFRAVKLYSSNLYVAIGRTTAWPNENDPPAPSESITEVEELIYIKKLNELRLVKQDAGGEIDYDGTMYTEVTEANAYSQNITSLYLTATIYYTDISPSITFRQIGILEDPKDSLGAILTGTSYLAASVADQGILHFVENRVPVVRNESQSEAIKNLITF